VENQFEKYQEFLKEHNPVECQGCGGILRLEKVNLEDYQEGKLYMMEQVPAFVCQECGEVWVPEPIMHEFERMIDTAKTSRAKINKKKKKPKTRKKNKGNKK